MFKKILATILCLFLLLPVLAGCGEPNLDYKGAYIKMYLNDTMFNYDPAYAYQNESALKVIALLFDNLFVLDKNGKVQKSLASEYVINENELANEYEMIITLKETGWTDRVPVTANDVVYSWKRILSPHSSSEAAGLLMDIKNAYNVVNAIGDVSVDDLGIYALNEFQLRILFEGKIDYNQFLLNLTSYALVPLREEIVVKNFDWAKKPATIISSGPFRLRKVDFNPGSELLVLERNPYYYRDITKDDTDKSVTPFQIIIDYTKSPDEIMQGYENGEIFYVGNIPMSYREAYKDKADISDALSTHSYVLNQNAVVRYYDASKLESLSSDKAVYDNTLVEGEDGEKILAIKDVRTALSLAIDREEIASAVVFAQAATAFVPPGVFDTTRKTAFREVGGDIISANKNLEEAKGKLSSAGVDPSKFMIVLSVPAYDQVHMLVAEKVKAAWEDLGFHVALNAINVITNEDLYAVTGEVAKDIKDDIFLENYNKGNFEIAAIDYKSFSANPFTSLALFAKGFSGTEVDMMNSVDDGQGTVHMSGYDNESYNEKIMAAHLEKNVANKTPLLHDAEKILLEDMPIIPIIFSQTATLTSKELSRTTVYYYGYTRFTKTKLKDYELYIPEDEK